MSSGTTLSVQIHSADGDRTLDVDSVVLAVGYVSDTRLADKLRESGISDIRVIGDARRVGNLMSTIYDAYEVAYAI